MTEQKSDTIFTAVVDLIMFPIRNPVITAVLVGLYFAYPYIRPYL